MKLNLNKSKLFTCMAYLMTMCVFMNLASCTMEDHAMPTTSVKPKGPKPYWAPDMKDEMWAVIEKLISYGDKPIEQSTPQEARMAHTVKDAVMDLMKENNIPMPPRLVDTTGTDIDVIGGTIHARIYTPQLGEGPFPVIVYYHGGGWVIANIDVYDASAQALAEKVGAIVVSVGYRKGPEKKFPTAHEDAYMAYQWVVKNAAGFSSNPKKTGNPMKVGVAGESAGGNLAANVSIKARDNGFQMPVHELLVYPVANSDLNSESFIKYAEAKPLNKPMIPWFLMHYLNNMSEAMDPRISLVKANLKNLPSTTIIGAEIDPLQTEGMLLKQKLEEVGVKTSYKLYLGTTHEFFGTAALVPDAKNAQDFAAAEFKKAFGM